MAAHLWASAPPPWEYIELILCRDVYHCTPPELDEIPAETIIKHLAILGIENEINQRRLKRK